MIVLIIARSNNFVNYRATLSIKDESEFAYIVCFLAFRVLACYSILN